MASPNPPSGEASRRAVPIDVDAGHGAQLDATLDNIYRTEANGLTSYFSRRLRKEDEPSDYVHETFVRLASFMSRQLVREPRHYLRTIARNLLFERTRRLQVRAAFPHVPLTVELEPSMPPDQAHRIEADQLLDAYRKVLGELPRKTRDIYLLHRVDELTYKEIGERMGISIPTVQYHVARALEHLDAALGQE
jgi:RNA polymerase sigma factor (sigma-70 family)